MPLLQENYSVFLVVILNTPLFISHYGVICCSVSNDLTYNIVSLYCYFEKHADIFSFCKSIPGFINLMIS